MRRMALVWMWCRNRISTYWPGLLANTRTKTSRLGNKLPQGRRSSRRKSDPATEQDGPMTTVSRQVISVERHQSRLHRLKRTGKQEAGNGLRCSHRRLVSERRRTSVRPPHGLVDYVQIHQKDRGREKRPGIERRLGAATRSAQVESATKQLVRIELTTSVSSF